MRVGVEHEYVVVGPAGSALDMRDHWSGLDLPGVRADPADPFAVRGDHGGVLTVDGPHAEVATPPLSIDTLVIERLWGHVEACASDLSTALGADHSLTGYSTHLNVSCRARTERRVGRELLRRWGPALMMFGLHDSSPGLLIRPRWSRVEIGCEYLGPPWMGPALALTAAAVEHVATTRCPPLPVIDLAVAPSRQRYGWYLDRTAPGTDLGESGRAARLRTPRGETIGAQEHLDAVWNVAEPIVRRRFGSGIADEIGATVRGRQPLAIERPPVTEIRRVGDDHWIPPRHQLVYVVGPVVVSPFALTWRRAVFAVRGGGPDRWISLPGETCTDFLTDLHRGVFDDVLLSGRSRRRLAIRAHAPDRAPK